MSTLATVAISVLRGLTRRPWQKVSSLVAGRFRQPCPLESPVAARVERLLSPQAAVFRIAQSREDYLSGGVPPGV